jgi:hypothetical protein
MMPYYDCDRQPGRWIDRALIAAEKSPNPQEPTMTQKTRSVPDSRIEIAVVRFYFALARFTLRLAIARQDGTASIGELTTALFPTSNVRRAATS